MLFLPFIIQLSVQIYQEPIGELSLFRVVSKEAKILNQHISSSRRSALFLVERWQDIKWMTSELWIGAPNNWASVAAMWSLAAFPNGVSTTYINQSLHPMFPTMG